MSGRELRDCTRPGCIEIIHSWRNGEQDEMCVTEGVTSPDRDWSVRGFWDDKTQRWDAFSDLTGKGEYDGADGLAELKEIVAAHALAQALCDALNSKGQAA